MKFIAIAALVATAKSADVLTGGDCSAKDAVCPSTDCCGTVTPMTKQSANGVMAASTRAVICHTKTAKLYSKDYGSSATTVADDFTPIGVTGKYDGDFSCNAKATGAASFSAAIAVLAASFYMV